VGGALEPEWAAALPEEGDDYEANARAKAQAAAAAAGRIAVADDSGLEVDALGGAPGPFSARYGGATLDARSRNEHLLAAMRGVLDADRGARCVWVAAVADPAGRCAVARGECAGRSFG
jgi:XTP/dITP diphosphohydrolase